MAISDCTTVRWLDRYLGQVICFLLRRLDLFRGKPAAGMPRAVLVIELFEMGSAVMCFPALRCLRAAAPGVELYCLCGLSTRQAWEAAGEISPENIFAIDHGSLPRFLLSALLQIWRLRRMKLDLVVDFGLFTRVSAVLAFLSKARRRAGFYAYDQEGLYRGDFYDVRCGFNQNMHIAKNFLALIKTALEGAEEYPNYKGSLAESDLSPPRYKGDAAARAAVMGQVKGLYPALGSERLVLVCPDVGPNLPMRNYPRPYYAEVIRRLLDQQGDLLVLLIGTRANTAACSAIYGEIGSPRCLDFCGRTEQVSDLLALMGAARLLICNDNGPIHFAAQTGTKTLALFSTDSPYIYGPLGDCLILYSFFHCSPCINAFNHKRSRCRDNRCLQSLSPETVLCFAARLLAGEALGGTINGTRGYR